MNKRPLLFSLQPNYANLIFNGEKTVELRRRAGKIANREVFVYVSSPNRILRGGFKIGRVWSDHPNNLWESVSATAGISQENYKKYYFGTDIAFALEISDIWEYETPKSLNDLRDQFPNFVVPQSYRQITGEEQHSWRRLKRRPRRQLPNREVTSAK